MLRDKKMKKQEKEKEKGEAEKIEFFLIPHVTATNVWQ